MGLINKIRQRTGIAVGIIALGLILFLVGGDLLSTNSLLLSRSRNAVGEIYGTTVSIDRYREVLEITTENYIANSGRSPDASNLSFIQNQAWERLITEIVHVTQFEKLGLVTHPAEVVDMVQGDHVRADIKQAFTDPNTKEFDKEKLRDYLKNLGNAPAADQKRWYDYETSIAAERSLQKYNNLFSKSNYVTLKEAAWQRRTQQTRLDIRYVYVPYSTLFDSLFTPTDDELKAYLKKNKAQYQVPRSRSVEYISFPLTPAVIDSVATKADLLDLSDSFLQASNDSIFAAVNSEEENAYKVYEPNRLPEALKGDSLVAGQIFGPYLDNKGYTLYKVSQMVEGKQARVQASHILLKVDDESVRAEYKKKIAGFLDDLLNERSTFESMARKHSMDASAAQGGDLGWFERGKMVAPFEEAAFGAQEIGLIPRVIETEFGYHLIKVTALATQQNYAIASILRSIQAGNNTRSVIYDSATAFIQGLSGENFEEQAKTHNLPIEEGSDLLPDAQRVGSIGNARSIVQWNYQADEDDVSDIFELDKEFVVAHLISIQAKGTKQLKAARTDLTDKVLAQKKGDQIIATLDTLTYSTLDELQTLYGSNSFVYSMNSLRLNSNTLRNAGECPDVIGELFTLPIGLHRNPFRTATGIIIVEITANTPPKEAKADEAYTQERSQLSGKRGNPGFVQNAIKFFSDIIDNRYKFF